MDPTSVKKKKKASYKDIHLPLGVVGGWGCGVCQEEHFFAQLSRERGVCARNSPQEH